jgi:hypothetical protein
MLPDHTCPFASLFEMMGAAMDPAGTVNYHDRAMRGNLQAARKRCTWRRCVLIVA